jgi:hypothetical protein
LPSHQYTFKGRKEELMEQAWFEMKAVRQRKLGTSVWIPLRAAEEVEKVGEDGYAGFKEEFFGAGTLAVPLLLRDKASELGWGEIGINHQHRPYFEKEEYIASDIFNHWEHTSLGIHLVLEQRFNSIETSEWHLHQDLVLALNLKREGDTWVSPKEGYLEVARLRKRSDGRPIALEVRAEHLRDYLCARGMALYVSSYRMRKAVVESASHLDWPDSLSCDSHGGDRWEGRCSAIHEGGFAFGSQTAVFHMFRTEVDSEVDVPYVFGPDSIESRTWTVGHDGRKLFLVQGELWRNEWVEPASRSPRVRGDYIPAEVYFVLDAEGKRASEKGLISSGRWLWFRPAVMMELCQRRGGGLCWYTRDTGSIWCSPDDDVHFGVNKLGLVNVFAKDIARLPDWEQRIWAGHNIGPEGGVSEELQASQARAVPADTQAPEYLLSKGLLLLQQVSAEKLGFSLLREHENVPAILMRSHRFRAVDKDGLLALAKDLARLTADSIDAAAIQKLVSPPKGIKLGSLKSLEQLLATQVPFEQARALLAPLFGIYELRNADAHLSTSNLGSSLQLASIDENAPPVHQGLQLLASCVSSLYDIASIIRDWRTSSQCEETATGIAP